MSRKLLEKRPCMPHLITRICSRRWLSKGRGISLAKDETTVRCTMAVSPQNRDTAANGVGVQ